jgi:F-box-like
MLTSIPVEVLLNILDYANKADLATVSRVNKICCSCAQDILYRDIVVSSRRHVIYRTLARSTHLATRVRSFSTYIIAPRLSKALQNMSSLRSLKLCLIGSASGLLDECTFKLELFCCAFPYDESLRNFLNSQQSLTSITFFTPLTDDGGRSMLEAVCLPNITQVTAAPSVLPYLIRGRPVSEVTFLGSCYQGPTDLGFLALSNVPIQKLSVNYSYLYPGPGWLLASAFPSLTHLTMAFPPRFHLGIDPV